MDKPTVSLHAGSQVTFEEAVWHLWERDCSPVDENHILPKSSVSPRDILFKIAKVLKPCVILRKFSVNKALFRDCRDFGLIPPDRVPQCEQTYIDALIISRSAGIILFFYLPNNTKVKEFILKKQAAIRAFCFLLSSLFDFEERVPVRIWLLASSGAQSKELESASLPTIQVVPRNQAGQKAKSTVDGSIQLGDEIYVEVCKLLNAIWRPRAIKIGTNRGQASSHQCQTATKGHEDRFENVADFLGFCESRMTDGCPKWTDYKAGRPYMIPKMFDFQRKDLTCKIGGRGYVNSFTGKQSHSDEPRHESQHRVLDDDVRGQEAEFLVYDNLERNARKTSTTLVTFSNLKFGPKAEYGYPLKILPEDVKEAEMDFVCISPKYGVHLFEVKGPDSLTKGSTVQARLMKAARQLRGFECCLSNLCRELEAQPNKNGGISVKAVVFPFLSCIDLYMKSGRIRRQITAEIVTPANEAGPNCFFRFKGLDVWCLGGSTSAEWPWLMERYAAQSSSKNDYAQILYRKLCIVLSRISAIRQSSILEDAQRIAQQNFSTKSNPRPEGWKATGEIPALGCLNVKFLTDEQMNAFHGPEYQIIQGSAGTGKTVLLMARMRNLLESGCSVLVIARHVSTVLYGQFMKGVQQPVRVTIIDRSGLHEAFPKTWQFLVERVRQGRWSMKEQAELLRECLFPKGGSSKVAALIRSDLEALQAQHGDSVPRDTPWHVLIDDGFLDIMQPQNPNRSKHDHELLIDVMLDRRIDSIASLWLAYDNSIFHYDNYRPYLGLPDETNDMRVRLYHMCYNIVRLKLPNRMYERGNPGMAYVDLNRVLRNARSVIQSSHLNVAPPDTLRGHNIAGMVPRSYDLTTPSSEHEGTDLLARIHRIVLDELTENLPKNDGKWLLRHAAVLVECWRPTSVLSHCLVDYFNRNGLITTLGFEKQLALALTYDRDCLAVDLDWFAHSIEWLIVFIIRIKTPDTRQRCLYVSRSRAVMLLVEIVVSPADVVPYVPAHELSECDKYPVRISDAEYERRQSEGMKTILAADPTLLKSALENYCGNMTEFYERIGRETADRLKQLIPEYELPEFQNKKASH